MGWVEDKIESAFGSLISTVENEGERTRAALSAALQATQRGNRLQGALSRPVTANQVNYAGAGRLVGWSIRASGGEVILDLYDGPNADPNRYVGSIDLASGSSQTVSMAPGGISITEQLYVAASGAGTPLGALWIGAVD